MPGRHGRFRRAHQGAEGYNEATTTRLLPSAKIAVQRAGAKDLDAVRAGLERIAAAPEFAVAVARLKTTFSEAQIGYGPWSARQKEALLDGLRSSDLSRSRFGQAIPILSKATHLVARSQTYGALDAWWADWRKSQRSLVVLGEEGDGKTWALADWLAGKLQQDVSFPPVVFINARAANSNDPLSLISGNIARQLRQPEERWSKRLERWWSHSTARPVLLLALDGINERQPPEFWRVLFEALIPLAARVAVMTTCRGAYWHRHFRQLTHIDAVPHTVQPFSQDELREALEARSLRVEDLPADLLPLLSKPRYFDLVLSHRDRLVKAGEFTRERLFYEDWQDRYKRKSGTLDDHAFKTMLMGLARQALEGERRHTRAGVLALLPGELERDRVLDDLSTGGVLVELQDRFVVQEDRLRLGFGLLLAEQVREAVTAGTAAMEDCIQSWLEPEPGMDVKSAALEAAAIHALAADGFPLAAATALLRAWAMSQNAPGREVGFPAYFQINPRVYFSLAEYAWADPDWQTDLHELLHSAFHRYRECEELAPLLVPPFERWLGFLHPAGFAGLYGGDSPQAERSREQITARIGHPAVPGPLDFDGYRVWVIEDPGLLRLGRLALAVISSGKRRPFIQAIATGCVTEALMDRPDKHDVFAWLMRSAPDAIEDETLRHASQLLQATNPSLHDAARRLLWYLGTPEALRRLVDTPAPRMPPWWDPCRHHFPWRREDAERCVEHSGFEINAVAHALAEASIDPTFVFSQHLRDRLTAFVATLLKDTLWSTTSVLAEDHLIEMAEPTLCAATPEQLADVFRAATQWFATRDGRPLETLFWAMRDHQLIFGPDEWHSVSMAVERVAQRVASDPEGIDKREKHVEAELVGLYLHSLRPDEQLRLLTRRAESAYDRLAYERVFGWPPHWDEVRRLLNAREATATLIRRVLWFLSARPQRIPSDQLPNLERFSRHEESLVRAVALWILAEGGSTSDAQTFLNSDWREDAAATPWEKRAGSHVWVVHGNDRPLAEIRAHIGLAALSEAVVARGLRAEEVREIALQLDASLSLGSSAQVLPSCTSSRPEADDAKDRHRLLDVRIPAEPFVLQSRANTWGDGPPPDPKAMGRALDAEASFNRGERLRRVVYEANKEQETQGNVWLLGGPPVPLLEAIIRVSPEISKRWFDAAVSGAEGSETLLRSSGFHHEFCAALLNTHPEEGLRLRQLLLETNGVCRMTGKTTGAYYVDLVLWRVQPTAPITNARRQMIREATSDLELSKVALAAEAGGQSRFLQIEIEGLLDSDDALDRARAVTLAGLVSDEHAWALCEARVTSGPPSWMSEVIPVARERRERNRFARHWFERFTAAQTDVHAWAAFRLFLRCVDRRFWSWRSSVESLAPSATYTERRRSFRRSEEHTIEQAIKEHEEPWGKVFLGHSILKGQVWPWLES